MVLKHLAALGNHAETVEALLANGAAVDATDEGTVGAAPLHFAANAGAHAVIDVLLRHNAALDLQSRDGRSVLQFASFCADPTVAERPRSSLPSARASSRTSSGSRTTAASWRTALPCKPWASRRATS